MRVFLTGGTGFLGSHVAERLLAHGHEVRALARRGADTSFLRQLGVELVTGDLRDPPGRLAELMAGCDALVHAAALLFRRGMGESAYRTVNVEGTERVLRAAAASGASRVVHVSSVAVYGAVGRVPITEDLWQTGTIPARAYYPRSKREAEAVAWRLHEAGVVRLTTVRPGMVYGERDRWFTPGIARITSLPVVPLPRGGHSTLPMVYAGNVADGIVAALERSESIGRAYNLTAERPLTVREIIETFGRVLGRVPRVVSVPTALALSVAAVGDVILRVLPGFGQPALGRLVRRLSRDDPYDTTRARRELGWQPRVAPEEALARTAAWYRDSKRDGAGARRSSEESR
ncbi:MAG TPA: NAD-dependent epimerase/dehydratase family protein [Longimicrobiales bacterium]|nr:NAD-dependent epimerase/dehydratase family protein [Longimicrobiales bacterium]